MLTLNDGRNELWQWDTGRKLTVDADCSQVHFSNKVFGRSVDVDVVDGIAIIPDILLQTDKELTAWAFVGTAESGYTKISMVFKVNKRNKPADYVFTPPEQTTLQELVERLAAIEESQDPDAIKNAVEDYLEQNPVESPVHSVNGKTGEVELTAEDVGAISQDDLQEATNEALSQAKASGEFNGRDGKNGTSATHSWNGTVLTITSASGTSSADLKGDTGDTGPAGPKGDTGETGPQGPAGKDGQNGKSAYQYAKDGGYTGTEEEFSEKLAKEYPTKVSELANDAGYLTGYTETDPTVPSWAKAATKPSYSKSEVGLGNVDNVKQYSSNNPPPYPVTKVNGKTGDVELDAEDVGARASTWMPTHSDVGADKSGTAASAVSTHNTKTDAHNDIRLLITALTTRMDALANSDDETLDQMAEVVAYIKANRDLIDQITTGKVSVTDIVNNLTTNVSNKPLSAAQGVALKSLIDGLSSGKLDAITLTEAINTALAQAKASGEFDGGDGTSVTVKSVSESAADGGSNVITFSDGKTLTVKNGSKGSAGATGERGTGLLAVTTAPSSYTTEVGGITPKYRMAISTIKSQAGVTEVLLGDTIRYSYYHYPIAYLDASYAYFTTRVSIRGATGAAGTTPVKGTDYFTEADKAEMVEDVKNSIPGLGDLLGGGVEEVTYVPSLDGYLKVETGAIYTGTAGTYHTDYIALEGYAEIWASCNISSQGYALAFFDSSKTLLPAISIVAEGSGVTKTINMEVPSEAAYCMLCDYEYAPPSNAFITLIPSRGIVERVDELDARTNPLNGKTIAVLGDSISSVAYTVPNYWQMIAEKTGCNFLDYGVSGSCFAVRSAEHTKSFLERAADMASADAVLVMGGTNDANKNILLGDWASTDNTTLYGSLNALIALLRSKYPGRPIVFCTPIKMKGDTDDGFPKTMADLKNATASTNLELWHCALAIQAKCAVHGIPVIDLYNASGIGSGLSGFFRPDDSLHPSILGECRIANMVQPVLEQQFLYTTEYVAEPVNLVPTSIDTDGSIFNGTGYKDGYRLSSSGNTSVQAGSTVTGFIEFITSDVLRIKGVTMTDSNAAGTYVNNSYIAFYDSAFTKIGVTNNAGGSGICPNAVNSYRTSETNGVHTYDFSAVDGTNVKYIRISSPFGEAGSGSGMFVTVNQEIT